MVYKHPVTYKQNFEIIAIVHCIKLAKGKLTLTKEKWNSVVNYGTLHKKEFFTVVTIRFQ